MAKKYPSITSYNYVGNNPVNAFDPNGEDGILTKIVDPNTKTVTVTLHMNLYYNSTELSHTKVDHSRTRMGNYETVNYANDYLVIGAMVNLIQSFLSLDGSVGKGTEYDGWNFNFQTNIKMIPVASENVEDIFNAAAIDSRGIGNAIVKGNPVSLLGDSCKFANACTDTHGKVILGHMVIPGALTPSEKIEVLVHELVHSLGGVYRFNPKTREESGKDYDYTLPYIQRDIMDQIGDHSRSSKDFMQRLILFSQILNPELFEVTVGGDDEIIEYRRRHDNE